MRSLKLLILGGTGHAIELAAALVDGGHHVVTSLAGVTRNPHLPAGEVRTGSLGGAGGLARFLAVERFDALIDATHPFAAVISGNAFLAASQTGVPLLRFERKAWLAGEHDNWISVATLAEAAAALPPGARVLLTTGRKELEPFMARSDLSGVARMIEPPRQALPERWLLLLKRPPSTEQEEKELLVAHSITHLVTKNAGGRATDAKLAAAAALSIPVIMIERPGKPNVESFDDVQAVVQRLGQIF